MAAPQKDKGRDKSEAKIEDSLAKLQRDLQQEAQEHIAASEKAKALIAALKQKSKS
jgi:hypothetical protein